MQFLSGFDYLQQALLTLCREVQEDYAFQALQTGISTTAKEEKRPLSLLVTMKEIFSFLHRTSQNKKNEFYVQLYWKLQGERLTDKVFK